ncbi:Protein of unknown function [Gryllus bimaculatus]|nr:Protein of unknown function [Gryllus bimaculatus]
MAFCVRFFYPCLYYVCVCDGLLLAAQGGGRRLRRALRAVLLRAVAGAVHEVQELLRALLQVLQVLPTQARKGTRRHAGMLRGGDKGGCCTRLSPCCASPRCFKISPCFARLACCRAKKPAPPAPGPAPPKGDAEGGDATEGEVRTARRMRVGLRAGV